MTVRFISVGLRVGLAVACVFATGAALAPGGLSPEKTQRFAANGLRLDDPQLVAKLKALAASRHAALFRHSDALIIKRDENAAVVAISIPFLRPPSAANTSPAGPVLKSINVAGENVTLSGQNLLSGGTPAVVPVVSSLSNCPAPGPLQLENVEANTTTRQTVVFGMESVPEPETAQLSTMLVTTGQPFTSPQSVKIYPHFFPSSANEFVDYMTPYFVTPDPLGQPASSYSSSGSHLSTDPSDPTSTGTDVLGYGTVLENGWTATASITSVQSYMDPDASNPTNDVFRSATISQQPSGGRLETRVAWSFQGGESISYALTWTFVPGPTGAGGRYVSTMPKYTHCSDEQ